MKAKKILPVLFLVFTMVYACKCSDGGDAAENLLEMSKGKIGGGKNTSSPVDYRYTVDDLCGDWFCNTVEGDLTEYFEIKISRKSESGINISNFHNLGKTVTASVSGSTLEFSGPLSSDYSVEGGSGLIDKSFGKIELSYSVLDLESGSPEKFRIALTKGKGEDILQNAR